MIQKPKGTYDLFKNEMQRWLYVEGVIKSVCEYFNYEEIRTPLFEKSELFHRGVGESTDIVTKETYTFTDRGNRSMTLRPEGTAGVLRSVIENKIYSDPKGINKLFYLGTMYRYERPQAGRFREFRQFGVEALGIKDARVDAEVVSMAYTIYDLLGLEGLKVKVNSLGNKESRDLYRTALRNHFKEDLNTLCSDCQTRYDTNPLRILDCKIDADKAIMKTAPKTIDYLTEESKQYFEEILKYLEAFDIPYEIDTSLVRGLDYYEEMVFEVHAEIEGFGSQSALCGGGRYDGLSESLDGPNLPGIGFALGMERLMSALELENIELDTEEGIDCYIMTLGDKAKKYGAILNNSLRMNGFKSETDYLDKSFKAQFKQADRYFAKAVIIIGDEEIDSGLVKVKSTETGIQEDVKIDDLVVYLDNLIKE